MNHPQLRRTFPSEPIKSEPSAKELAFLGLAEKLGLPSSFTVADDWQYRATRVPFNKGFRSMTMDGEPAVRGAVRMTRTSDERFCRTMIHATMPPTGCARDGTLSDATGRCLAARDRR